MVVVMVVVMLMVVVVMMVVVMVVVVMVVMMMVLLMVIYICIFRVWLEACTGVGALSSWKQKVQIEYDGNFFALSNNNIFITIILYLSLFQTSTCSRSSWGSWSSWSSSATCSGWKSFFFKIEIHNLIIQ